MKKILIVTDAWIPQVNGVVTTLQNVTIKAREAGYAVDIIEPSQFTNFPTPGYSEIRMSIPFGLSKKIRESNPDYIHIATEGTLGFSARNWCVRNKFPFTTSYHTRFPEFIQDIYGLPSKYTYPFLRWFHSKAKCVLVTTKGIAEEMKNNGFKQELVPWTRGVDRDNLKTTGNLIFDLLPKPVLLNVGRVSKEKGLDDLIPLSEKYSIVIVGDGPYREELAKKAPNIIFLGYKKGPELADCFAASDVFVFPSIRDTFGIVIIEAMSQGTPVAAYPVRGPLDIIENGLTGYMENDLEIAVQKCLSLDREKIQKDSERWTWDNCWKIFEEAVVK